jgi:hypothetical protein
MADLPKDVTEDCCADYASTLGAETDTKLRLWGFIFSAGILSLLLTAHVVFEWSGRHLTIPDIVWTVVLAPWLGASIAKLLRLIKR